VKIIWVEGPKIQKILKRIQSQNIDIGRPGKGQSVWIGMGYFWLPKGFPEHDDRALDAVLVHDKLRFQEFQLKAHGTEFVPEQEIRVPVSQAGCGGKSVRRFNARGFMGIAGCRTRTETFR